MSMPETPAPQPPLASPAPATAASPAAGRAEAPEPSSGERAARWGRQAASRAAEAALSIAEATISVALELLRRGFLSWGAFELAKLLLPHPVFLAAHAVVILGAAMIAGGLIGFVLCLPWAAVCAFVDWANPVQRGDAALTRMYEWGRFVIGWIIWTAPWALSAWMLSQPWRGHWADLGVQLAHWLKIG